MKHRDERRAEAPRLLDLLLAARTTAQRAAAWAAFKELYGASVNEAFTGKGGEARSRELLPPERQADLLRRHVEESRVVVPDEEYGYRLVLGTLAERIDGPLDPMRDTLEDMLRNGPDRLTSLAGTILLTQGDAAWSLWPALRDAMSRPKGDVVIGDGVRDALMEVVTRCVEREPSRLDEVEKAAWETFAPGFVGVLRDLGPRAASTAPLLALILGDHSLNGTSRWRALEVLGAIQALPPEAVDALLGAIDDPIDDIAERAMAIAAWRRLDPARFAPVLARRVGDTSWSGEHGHPGAAARAALIAYGVEPAPQAPIKRPGAAPEPSAAGLARMELAEQRLQAVLRRLDEEAEARGRKRSGPEGVRRKR